MKTFALPRLSARSYIAVFLAILALTVTSPFLARFRLLLSHLSYKAHSSFSTSPSMSYPKELRIASLAIQRATILTRRVFHDNAKGTLSKDDHSPVTVGDFGAQALIINALRHNFPDDEIVAEEDANDLKGKETLSRQVWDLVRSAKLEDQKAEEDLGGPVEDVDRMLSAIDAGKSMGGDVGRVWALDPIDGTKGFLRGGQYAVGLALIEDGDVKVGVMGCPNLPLDNSAPLTADVGTEGEDENARGVVFTAVLGQGAKSIPLGKGELQEGQTIHMKELRDITQATFCESVEAGHSNHGDQAAIAQKLGITNPSVRMDSQGKYASIARGAGDLYLRLPVSKDYQEKIWDHAAGDLIVREAGGQVTDAAGKRLDFGKGRFLTANKGFVAAPKAIHAEVLEVVKSVLSSK